MLGKELGLEGDVTGLVDTLQRHGIEEIGSAKGQAEADAANSTHVDVTEASSNAEVGGDGAELAVDIPDVLGLGVQSCVVDTLVVHTVLLTTGDTDLHLEPDADLGHAGKVLLAGLDVLLLGLLGEIEHVRAVSVERCAKDSGWWSGLSRRKIAHELWNCRLLWCLPEEGLVVALEVSLVSLEHACGARIILSRQPIASQELCALRAMLFQPGAEIISPPIRAVGAAFPSPTRAGLSAL